MGTEPDLPWHWVSAADQRLLGSEMATRGQFLDPCMRFSSRWQTASTSSWSAAARRRSVGGCHGGSSDSESPSKNLLRAKQMESLAFRSMLARAVRVS
jgi:hypothetical protein